MDLQLIKYHRGAMIRVARLLLFIMLAVSLPFHAAYAVGISQCAAVQQSREQSDQHVSHADHGIRGGHDQSTHAHSGVQHDEEGSGGTLLGSSHCGSCAACGVSAAITGSDRLDFPSGDYPGPYAIPEKRLVSVASPRLDRPPLAH